MAINLKSSELQRSTLVYEWDSILCTFYHRIEQRQINMRLIQIATNTHKLKNIDFNIDIVDIEY